MSYLATAISLTLLATYNFFPNYRLYNSVTEVKDVFQMLYMEKNKISSFRSVSKIHLTNIIEQLHFSDIQVLE